LKVSYCHVHPNYLPANGSSFKKGELITKVGPKNVYGIHNNPYKDSNGNPTNGAMTGCHLHLTFKENNKLLEAQRIEERTNFDIEMMKETGFCQGIENYSRHISGRAPGSTPFTLFDYFPEDYLLLIDESHATIPQVRAMYNGDRARKETLVNYGFRLPSAFDNRPLKFHEFEERINQCIFVSATPADYEKEHSNGNIVEKEVEKDAPKVSKDAKKDVAKLDKDAKKDAAKADKAVKEDAKKAEKAAKDTER